jgi:hypothetical protein
MKYPKSILAAVIILAGVVAGIFTQYDLFADYLTILAALACVVPITFFLGLFALTLFIWKRRVGKFLSFSTVIGGATVASLIAWFMTGDLIDRWKVDAVESYVAHAAPILDQIEKKEGSYPSKLPIDQLGAPPELLRNDGDYTATQHTFRFEYVDEPAGWAGGEGLLEFDSGSREWDNVR